MMRAFGLFLVGLFFSSAALAQPTPDGFADLSAKLIPAVVNISTMQKIVKDDENAKEGPMQPLPPGHPMQDFNEFFKNFMQPPEDRDVTSLGSGFIVDPSGIIVTNNHVIADAEEITVSLDDNSQYKATVIGKDSKTDLAVLKINAGKPLPYVSFGESDGIRVGDWVIAIGNPYGLGGTVTAGIISARARDINAGPFDDFLQTDAAINRGNSGGPMFNMKGEVVGINTAIFSPTGGSVGIGFAVPSSLAEPIIKQLREGKKITRGWLGVKIQAVSPEIAESLGMKEPKGALVVGMTPNSPAKKAKIESGDVIVRFNGKEIDTMRKLPRVVAETPIGKEVDIEVVRNGKVKKLEVTVGKMDESEEKKPAEEKPSEAPARKGETVLDMQLTPITDEIRSEYGLAASARGILVMEMKEGSVAQKKGIEAGDVIVEAGQKPMRTVADFKDAITYVKDMKRKSILLYLLRDGETLFMALPIE
jgi:serine protease Do